MTKAATSIIVILLFTAFAGAGFADTIDAIGEIADITPFLTPEAQSELYHTGKTGRFYFEPAESTRYLPKTPFSQEIEKQLSELSPNIGVETIYLLEAPGIIPTEEQFLEVYNLLRRLSSLEGIEYFSASRDRMRTFFKQFYTIDNPENENRLPDQLVTGIPEADILYAFQEDLTFGSNISRLEYQFEKPFIALSIINLEKMRYALIPLIQEEDMQMYLILYLLEGHIMFYGNCGVSTIEFLGLVKKKKESFSNRVEAMYRWFSEQYDPNS